VSGGEGAPTPEAVPSDDDPAIAATGTGDVAFSVVSMSERHAEGRDHEYLDWHLTDHLPEQHRLAGLRRGQRWVSTPACRSARAASEPALDGVDHLVQYLFAEPVEPALDQFFSLGAALHGAGRMPIALPRVQVGGWDLVGALAARRALVGEAVLPWLPSPGVYVVVEEVADIPASDLADGLDALVSVPGVAGVWWWSGSSSRHERLDPNDDLALTICYLDEPPVEVAAALVPTLEQRWSAGGWSALLAAPFTAVDPHRRGDHLP
jgi:hypothetical protein